MHIPEARRCGGRRGSAPCGPAGSGGPSRSGEATQNAAVVLQESNGSAWGRSWGLCLVGLLMTESHNEETRAAAAALPVLLWGF